MSTIATSASIRLGVPMVVRMTDLTIAALSRSSVPITMAGAHKTRQRSVTGRATRSPSASERLVSEVSAPTLTRVPFGESAVEITLAKKQVPSREASAAPRHPILFSILRVT